MIVSGKNFILLHPRVLKSSCFLKTATKKNCRKTAAVVFFWTSRCRSYRFSRGWSGQGFSSMRGVLRNSKKKLRGSQESSRKTYGVLRARNLISDPQNNSPKFFSGSLSFQRREFARPAQKTSQPNSRNS